MDHAKRSSVNPPEERGPHLDRNQRFWALALGCSLLGLLVVARILSPSPDGIGTHQQLGLPPCTFVGMFGIRCPTCGMTTSWSHLMHGDLLASWRANPGGTCLAIVASIAGIWSIATAGWGRYWNPIPARVGGAIAIAITAITLIDWVSEIF